MFQTTYQLLSFVDEARNIRGRKKLQKIIHLLKSAGTDFPFIYRYHHYGPYSSQLQSEMDQLVKQEYVSEDFIDGAYEYTLTEKGKMFRQMLEEDGRYTFKVEDETFFNELISKEAPFLEMFSTYVFLRQTGDTETEAIEGVKQLKEHLIGHLDDVLEIYDTYFTH